MSLNERQEMIYNRLNEEDFIEYLEDLIRGDQLCDSAAAEGIAKKIIGEGTINNLSTRQIETLIVFGIDTENNYLRKCKRCDDDIPWSEMIMAAETGYCGYHLHKAEKGE